MTEPTAVGLRGALFETLDGLREGSTKPREAKAICEVASRILETVRVEMVELEIVSKSIELQALMGDAAARVLAGEVDG
jgi:hypothetical protein